MNQSPITKNKRDDLVYPESSFKIIGCAFEVYNELGYGYAEKIYQKALAVAFSKQSISFQEQVYFPVKFMNEIIAKGYSDFVVEEKIIVELKKNARFSKSHIDKVNQYLKSSGLKLALLINFTPTGVVSKRLLNINQQASKINI